MKVHVSAWSEFDRLRDQQKGIFGCSSAEWEAAYYALEKLLREEFGPQASPLGGPIGWHLGSDWCEQRTLGVVLDEWSFVTEGLLQRLHAWLCGLPGTWILSVCAGGYKVDDLFHFMILRSGVYAAHMKYSKSRAVGVLREKVNLSLTLAV
ncbi:MAG: hypothetical protein HYY24_06290 [Verrucomicrobia bacterium]|nr:hypothetical protein [Verrucomicrobiota bacterium]